MKSVGHSEWEKGRETEREGEEFCYERQSTYFRFCGGDRLQVLLGHRADSMVPQEGCQHVSAEQRLQDPVRP